MAPIRASAPLFSVSSCSVRGRKECRSPTEIISRFFGRTLVSVILIDPDAVVVLPCRPACMDLFVLSPDRTLFKHSVCQVSSSSERRKLASIGGTHGRTPENRPRFWVSECYHSAYTTTTTIIRHDIMECHTSFVTATRISWVSYIVNYGHTAKAHCTFMLAARTAVRVPKNLACSGAAPSG